MVEVEEEEDGRAAMVGGIIIITIIIMEGRDLYPPKEVTRAGVGAMAGISILPGPLRPSLMPRPMALTVGKWLTICIGVCSVGSTGEWRESVCVKGRKRKIEIHFSFSILILMSLSPPLPPAWSTKIDAVHDSSLPSTERAEFHRSAPESSSGGGGAWGRGSGSSAWGAKRTSRLGGGDITVHILTFA